MQELDPITVWMVHLDRGQADRDVKGTLAITDDVLVFSDAREHLPITFPYDAIRRARRLHGSPVLLVEWTWDDSNRKTAFYFTQPPPLKPPVPGTTSVPGDPFANRRSAGAFDAFRRAGRRRLMRNNIRYLQTIGIGRKELIQAWADEVTARTRAGGS